MELFHKKDVTVQSETDFIKTYDHLSGIFVKIERRAL